MTALAVIVKCLGPAAYEGRIKSLLKEWQEAEIVDEDGFTAEQRDILKAEAGENTEPYEWWNDEEMVMYGHT